MAIKLMCPDFTLKDYGGLTPVAWSAFKIMLQEDEEDHSDLLDLVYLRSGNYFLPEHLKEEINDVT